LRVSSVDPISPCVKRLWLGLASSGWSTTISLRSIGFEKLRVRRPASRFGLVQKGIQRSRLQRGPAALTVSLDIVGEQPLLGLGADNFAKAVRDTRSNE